MKGKYKLTYIVDKHEQELLVEVELKPNDTPLEKFQNVYSGRAYVDGTFYNKEDLSHCVNAKFAAESIGLKLKEELKTKFKEDGKRFKIKKEEIK